MKLELENIRCISCLEQMLDNHCFLALVWKLLLGGHQKTGSDWNLLEHIIFLVLYGVNLLGIKKNIILRNTEK